MYENICWGVARALREGQGRENGTDTGWAGLGKWVGMMRGALFFHISYLAFLSYQIIICCGIFGLCYCYFVLCFI